MQLNSNGEYKWHSGGFCTAPSRRSNLPHGRASTLRSSTGDSAAAASAQCELIQLLYSGRQMVSKQCIYIYVYIYIYIFFFFLIDGRGPLACMSTKSLPTAGPDACGEALRGESQSQEKRGTTGGLPQSTKAPLKSLDIDV